MAPQLPNLWKELPLPNRGVAYPSRFNTHSDGRFGTMILGMQTFWDLGAVAFLCWPPESRLAYLCSSSTAIDAHWKLQSYRIQTAKHGIFTSSHVCTSTSSQQPQNQTCKRSQGPRDLGASAMYFRPPTNIESITTCDGSLGSDRWCFWSQDIPKYTPQNPDTPRKF